MSYGGVSPDDWALTWNLIGGGAGLAREQFLHSSLSNPLTASCYGDYCLRFNNVSGDKGSQAYEYLDPRQGTNRFAGNTKQSIWCVWRAAYHYFSGFPKDAFHPNLVLALRAKDRGSGYHGYYLVIDWGGMFLDTNIYWVTGLLNPYRVAETDPGDGAVYHEDNYGQNTWNAAKLEVEPDGADQIIRAYHCKGPALINSTADAYGEPEWTQVMEVRNNAVGADVVTLGTKRADFAYGPYSDGLPQFQAHGYYSGYVYNEGWLYVDGVGVKVKP